MKVNRILTSVLMFSSVCYGVEEKKHLTDSPLVGKNIYLQDCAFCHNSGRDGAPVIGKTSDWAARVPEWRSVLEEHAIRGFINMPAKGGNEKLSARQVSDAVDYMVSQLKINSINIVNPDIAYGREVYNFNCAACHNEGQRGAPVIGDKEAWINRSPQWPAVAKLHVKNGFLNMPPSGGNEELSDEDLSSAVNYMLIWVEKAQKRN